MRNASKLSILMIMVFFVLCVTVYASDKDDMRNANSLDSAFKKRDVPRTVSSSEKIEDTGTRTERALNHMNFIISELHSFERSAQDSLQTSEYLQEIAYKKIPADEKTTICLTKGKISHILEKEGKIDIEDIIVLSQYELDEIQVKTVNYSLPIDTGTKVVFGCRVTFIEES